MEFYSIDISKKFKCVANKCEYTCCKGWLIPVDDETYARYSILPGQKGRLIRMAVKTKEPKRFRKCVNSCVFLTSNGLCRHELKGNKLLMPVICRNFPRRVLDFGERRESTLELSCPEAARLFLEEIKVHNFIEDEKRESILDFYNDDKDFLNYLLSERKRLVDYVIKDGPLWEKWESIYAYIYNVHDLIARDKILEAMKLDLSEDKSLQGQHAIYSQRKYAFYPVSVIDRMILEEIDRSAIIVKMPRFYKYIKGYIKIFSKKNVNEADAYFSDIITQMCEKYEHLEMKYKSYFTYLMQQEFLVAYESYSLIREVALCILYTQLLMMFDLTEYVRTGALNKKNEISILYLCEHNIRHNPALIKNLYGIIREEIL